MLDPIPTKDLSSEDVHRIALETREKMLAVLQEISPKSSSHPVNGDAGPKKEL